MTTLTIKDLSLELDGKAMSAVHGGQDDQANGISQSNGQAMQALANIGNGSMFTGGPATLQSNNTFTQSATNCSYASNADLFSIGGGCFPYYPVR